MSNRDDEFYAAVDEAISWGGSVGAMSPSEAFDVAATHVSVLLEDAASCYERGSYGTSVFLSITALEETAKAELLNYRARGGDGKKKKGRDPMRDHVHKHRIAVRPTTFMGRLPSILGAESCARLDNEAATGTFGTLRETALYVRADVTGVHAPATEITQKRARELLLLALEAADDVIVGYTSLSLRQGKRFEELISRTGVA